MSLAIIDNHSGKHGPWVTQAASEHYSGEIAEYDLGSPFVTLPRINYEFRQVLNDAQAGSDISVVNLSYGSGETVNPGALDDYTNVGGPTLHALSRDLWSEDVWITVSAGNAGTHTSNYLAATPFNMGVGATGPGGLAEYSQYHERLTGAVTDGSLEVDGQDKPIEGTSFSSPRVSGALADTKEQLDLSNPELLTAYQQTADQIVIDQWDEPIYAQQLDAGALADLDGPQAIEDQEVVDAAYRLFLGRQPDEQGAEYWVDDGADLSVLSAVAQEGDDYNADLVPIMQRVQSAYHVVLEREADLDGMAYWSDQIIAIDDGEGSFGGDQWGDSWQEFLATFTAVARDNGEEIHNYDAIKQFIESPVELIGNGPESPSSEFEALG